jgi:hypothetical protein
MSFSQYQIKSSHNSYLPKAQVCWCKTNWKSYINSLLNNHVRCLELDCWSENSKIVVAHEIETGSCIIQCSQKILFTDIITEIYDNFSNDSYKMPLIINLELHLSKTSQDILAKIIRETIGDILVTTKINTKINKPEEFMEKIIILSSGKIESENLRSVTALEFDNTNLTNVICKDFDFDKYKDLIHDKEMMVRVYPDNVIISKNYDVKKFLEIGCQLVSVNFQYNDDNLKYYNSYFENHDGYKRLIF